MKARKFVLILILVLAVLIVAGSCATLFNDKNLEVFVYSEPEVAKVYIDGHYMGVTPLQVNLAVDKEYEIKFRKEGYETKTYFLNNEVGGVWMVLDILCGLIPLAIDAASGDWYELETDDVKVILE
jgi:hypothetical protein